MYYNNQLTSSMVEELQMKLKLIQYCITRKEKIHNDSWSYRIKYNTIIGSSNTDRYYSINQRLKIIQYLIYSQVLEYNNYHIPTVATLNTLLNSIYIFAIPLGNSLLIRELQTVLLLLSAILLILLVLGSQV